MNYSSVLVSVEDELLRIFQDLLQLDDVTGETDFLTAGGDSLAAVVLRVRINQSFGVEIPMESFQGNLTPARLSALIASCSNSRKGAAAEQQQREPPFSPAAVKTQVPGSSGVLPSRRTVVEVGTKRQDVLSNTGTGVKNLIIIGAGECGREFYVWASQAIAAGASLRIKGFLDDRPDALQGREYKGGILGSISRYEIAENDVFVSAFGNPATKARLCSGILERGGLFINIIHPLANVGLNVDFGTDVVMGPFSSVTCDTKIGSHVSVGALSNVAHDCEVGDYCQISSHCGVNGNASLEAGVFLGSHACILPSVKVGSWSFVGAGSIVVRNVPSRTKVFGNPASVIGTMQDC